MARHLNSARTIMLGAMLFLASTTEGTATMHGHPEEMGRGGKMMDFEMMSQGLMMPRMNPGRGRVLFAQKGCVVCHAVNGIGGEDAPPFDASTMERLMNPFEFAARMWRGAEAMIYLQREELGEPIELTGDELADIIAFTHHPEEQAKFSEADIPSAIKNLMHHMEEEEPHEDEGGHGAD